MGWVDGAETSVRALAGPVFFQRMVSPLELRPRARSTGQKRVMPSATFMALNHSTERVKKLVRYGQRAMRLMAQEMPTSPTVIRSSASQVPTFFFNAVHLNFCTLAFMTVI